MPKKGDSSSVWKSDAIPTLDLRLDIENPRIRIDSGATQEEIRLALLRTEKIDELARGIVKTNGLMAGERIIVVKDGAEFLVLEGNRRVCACQLLIDSDLIPQEFRERFPASSQAIRTAISRLGADVSPSRDSAEPIITRRHTEAGIERWSPMANHRRLLRLLQAGKSLDEICSATGMTLARARRLLRDARLMDVTRKLGCWNESERRLLDAPDLEPNPFTRFFTLKGVTDRLRAKFADDGNLKSDLSSEAYLHAVEFLARQFLIPSTDTGKLMANTRDTPEVIFERLQSEDPALCKKLGPGGTATPPKKRKIKGQVDGFFESLACPANDARLRRLTEEISTFPFARFPTAATFLVRALIESSLDFAVKHAGLEQELRRSYHTRTKQIGRDAQLDFVITYCQQNHSKIFTARNAERVMAHWRQVKNVADLVIHGKWLDANPETLKQAASVVRPFVSKILDNSALVS
jgi:hypothetical protein